MVRGGLTAMLLCCAGCSPRGAEEDAAMRQIGEEQALARAAAMLETPPVPASTPPADAVPHSADQTARPAT